MRPGADVFYRMADGAVYIFEVLDDENRERILLKPIGKGMFFFEEISIGTEDYTIAMQEAVKLEVRIRILQNRNINNSNVVRVKSVYYNVWKVKHAFNKRGLLITDLTLTAISSNYEVIAP
jgi:hypothetical protein